MIKSENSVLNSCNFILRTLNVEITTFIAEKLANICRKLICMGGLLILKYRSHFYSSSTQIKCISLLEEANIPHRKSILREAATPDMFKQMSKLRSEVRITCH